MTEKRIALNSLSLGEPTEGTLPTRILLIPAGKVAGRDGREWRNSAPESVLANFVSLGRDLPIDIEHASELQAPKGGPAPAVAWIKSLNIEEGAIWGDVEWLARGRRLVQGRAYRYHSPVILYRPSDRVITGLASIGLTNQPNLRLGALNTQQAEEDVMDELKKIKAELGLAEDATIEQVMEAIAKLKGDLASATNRAETWLDLAKFVPRGDYDQVLTRARNAEESLATDKKARLDADIDAAITAALTAGKITPATAAYHWASCQQSGGLERFLDFIKAAPVLVADSGLDSKQPGGGNKALNAEEKQVCELLGIAEADYLKTVA